MKRLCLIALVACTRPAPLPPPSSAPYAATTHGWAAPPPLAPPLASPPSQQPPASHGSGHQAPGPVLERGQASYYHDSLAGNPTASGQPYDPAALTAAHRTLPFGSVVDVVRSDGRWVRVRINDRGPFKRGRVIDLSRRAAEHVDMIQAGLADVALYLVWQPSQSSHEVTAP